MLLADGGRATSESGLAFWFEEPVVVVSALPSVAPAAAAVTVTVTGAGFRNTAALSCRVGRGASAGGDASTAAVAASARWLSATAVECVLPARAVGNATLHVSNDGVVYSATGARVEALAVPDAGLAAARTAVYVVRVLRVELDFVTPPLLACRRAACVKRCCRRRRRRRALAASTFGQVLRRY